MRTALLLGVLSVAALACGADSDDLCPGLAHCGSSCADLDNDPDNCGTCGNACPGSQVCVAGTCTASGCSDECPTLGSIHCADPPANGLEVCADFDGADRCLEWGSYTPCDPGETCTDGVCAGGCVDECGTEGERWCDGAGYRECGRFGGSPCLTWSEVFPCDAGFSCSGGECSAECLDDCLDGERICDGDRVRTCGSFDDDACLDWSSAERCADDQACEAGTCVERVCLEENEDCVCGEDQCCEGHCCPFFFICISWDPQEDWCPNGPGPHA